MISAFVFATGIVQSLFLFKPKFQVSSHILWLHSPVCVRPGQNPHSLVFSRRGSYFVFSANCKEGEEVQGTKCVRCSAGMFKKEPGSSTRCIACPANMYSGKGATECYGKLILNSLVTSDVC